MKWFRWWKNARWLMMLMWSPPGLKAPSANPFSKPILCPQCGEQFSPFSEGSRGWNSKPHEVCKNCFRTRRKQQHKGHNASGSPTVSSIRTQEPDSLQVVSQIIKNINKIYFVIAHVSNEEIVDIINSLENKSTGSSSIP